jgi:formylglycine-generating enzyme
MCRTFFAASVILATLVVASPFVAQEAPPNMALVPAGEFWQGRVYMTLIDELGMLARARMDDLPAHQVSLDAYYIDKYEVTNADYLRFTDAAKHRKPYHWVGGKVPAGEEKYPVYNVSWDDAVGYCTWAGKRLPSEAEWEKAARGGQDRLRFPWGDALVAGGASGARGGGGGAAKAAHYGWPEGPVAVGGFPPNGFGIYDVVGNIAEWVHDWYAQNYYSVSPDRNPQGPAKGMYRVVRGNAWNADDERHLAVNYRNFAEPETRTVTIGFRCAK